MKHVFVILMLSITAVTMGMGQLHHFTVDKSGGGTIPDQSVSMPLYIQVLAQDSANNTVTTFTGTVEITSNGTLQEGSGTTAAFVNGVLDSHRIRFASAGLVAITATQSSGSINGVSNSFTVNNPIPTLGIINPLSRAAGSTSFTLLVTGSSFVSTSEVRFNGVSRLTAFIDSAHLSATIFASELDTAGTFPVTVETSSPGGGVSNALSFAVLTPVVNTKIYLQGPFHGSSMRTTLRSDNLLPLGQPYTVAPWNYTGSESVLSIPPEVVDWVLIELRTGTSNATRVARRAAFIRSDGIVAELDGTSPVAMDGIGAGNYYLVLRHRTHLSIMSATPVAVTESSSVYDFTTSSTMFFGGEAKSLPGARFAMFAGDYSSDGFIDSDDFIGPDNDNFLSGYRKSDLNMDGFVDSDDFINPDNNVFRGTRVPN